MQFHKISEKCSPIEKQPHPTPSPPRNCFWFEPSHFSENSILAFNFPQNFHYVLVSKNRQDGEECRIALGLSIFTLKPIARFARFFKGEYFTMMLNICGRCGGLMQLVYRTVWVLNPAWLGYCIMSLGNWHLTRSHSASLQTLSIQVYEWVQLANIILRVRPGLMNWLPIQGELEIFLVTSCYVNQRYAIIWWPLGLYVNSTDTWISSLGLEGWTCSLYLLGAKKSSFDTS